MQENSQATILIVDDEPINLQVLAAGLSKDYRVLMARTGQQALKIARQQQPDLVLLDISLPDISGYEVCKRLKRESDTQSIPVIFISGRDNDEDEVKGLKMGASDYVTKPFTMPLVSIRIKNQLELIQKTALLEQLASLDGLTEIPNRRQFDLIYAGEWRRAVRRDYVLSVALIDIDHFKLLNDTYGHAVGDEALIKVAHTLEQMTRRAGDFVARYGGEEFALILPNSDQQGASEFCQRLADAVKALAIPNQGSSVADVVTLSIGVVSCPASKADDRMRLLQAADANLYQAKEGGRDQVCASTLKFTPE